MEAKLKVARDWATPMIVKDIQSFLGFANHQRRFIQDFAAIVDLDILNKKGSDLAMGTKSTMCLSTTEGIIMCYTNFVIPRP